VIVLSRRIATAVSLMVGVVVALGAGAPPAAAETHPFLSSFGSFTKPNGIAVEESTGDVYVADIATNTVYRFDASGSPVAFPALGTNALTGSATLAHSFSFPEAPGTPAEIVVDNSTSPFDASAGDLYVMDAGHGAVDKFSASGEYLSQIPGPVTGFAIGTDGEVQVENNANEHGFAAGPTGIAYELSEHVGGEENPPCGGCVEKYGGSLDGTLRGPLPPEYQNRLPNDLGQVDSGPGDVAVAVDPVSGHLYADDQSSVAEWDTGAMDGQLLHADSYEVLPSAELVSSFGSSRLSGISGQGGIAVDGATGEI